jgi:dTDP-4-amino-4,6-dideoxygalactose transaminase
MFLSFKALSLKMIPRRSITLYKGFEKELCRYILDKEFRHTDFLSLFKNSLKKHLGEENIFLLGSGRQALEIIFGQVNIEKRDEIILSNYNLKALLPLILRFKLKPVFVDISPTSYCVEPKRFEKAITSKTKFVILTHMFGACTDISKFVEIAIKHNILIIEDCAHAFGSEYKGRKLGSFGDFSFFSFDYIKPLSTMGGGALIINNRQFKHLIPPIMPSKATKMTIYYFMQQLFLSPLIWPFIKRAIESPWLSEKAKQMHNSASKANGGLSNLQALVGQRELEQFPDKHKQIANKYELFKSLLNPKLKLQYAPHNTKLSYYFVTLRTKNAAKASKVLSSKGLDVGIKSDVADICSRGFPNSTKVFNTLIQVPFYYGLSDKKVKRIANILNSMVNKLC